MYLFYRMIRQSRILFRLSVRSNVHSWCRQVQTAGAVVSGKHFPEPRTNARDRGPFPIHATVLTRIRCDILSKDAYEGRIIGKKMAGRELLKSKLNVSNQSVSSAPQQLKTLTAQEMIDFICELACSILPDKEIDSDVNILEIVENECCSRAKHWDSIALLLVADAFLVMGYRCSRYLSAMFREFEHRWTSMEVRKEDVVQLATCIIMERKFPKFLVKNIEEFLESNIEEFSASELSVICSAFFVTNTSFGNVEMMEKLANSVLQNLPGGNLTVYQL